MSILDVVERAGYADQLHMTHALKYRMGQTPAQIVSRNTVAPMSFLYKTLPFWGFILSMFLDTTKGDVTVRKINAALFMTLDGVVEAPGSADTTLPDKRGWSMPFVDDEVGQVIGAGMAKYKQSKSVRCIRLYDWLLFDQHPSFLICLYLSVVCWHGLSQDIEIDGIALPEPVKQLLEGERRGQWRPRRPEATEHDPGLKPGPNPA
jgi:hypothetical protein